MPEQDLAKVEDCETADWEEGELQVPTRSAKAVIPIRFTADELGRVEEAARQAGMRLTEYIHAAVLAQAQG